MKETAPANILFTGAVSYCVISELGVAGSTRERNHVAYVGHAGNEEHKALKAEPEAAVRHRAVTTGIEIPPHILHRYAKFFDAGKELVVISLTLAAADNLADLGEEHVHGAHGAAIVVLLHVEGLDFTGIVGKYHRLAEMLFHEVALVLALEVGAPVDGELELAARCLEYLDTFGIGKAHEVVVEHELQTAHKLLVEMLGEEVDIVATVVESIADTVLHELLCKIHIVGNVVERHFGLYHPELGEVARRVAVLGAESRTEGVYRSESRGSELAFELAAHGKSRGLPEEVLAVIHGTLFGPRKLFEGQGGYLEHGAGTLAVAFGDKRRVEVVEAFFLKELMDSESQGAAHSQDGSESGGAGTQVRFLAQELEGVALLLQGVACGVGSAVYLKGVGLY